MDVQDKPVNDHEDTSMTWKQEKLLEQIDVVRSLGSGGLAWHLMSPVHVEDKILHDHSDIDLFSDSQEVFPKLKEMGFRRYWTKYATDNFYRYGRTAQSHNSANIHITLTPEWYELVYCASCWDRTVLKKELDQFGKAIQRLDNATKFTVIWR